MIFCPCSIGVEVYQTSLPSAFALATSTASCAWAGARRLDRATRVAESVVLAMVLSLFVMRGLCLFVMPGPGSSPGQACAGHPRLFAGSAVRKTWMAGTSPAMTTPCDQCPLYTGAGWLKK